MKLNLHRVSGVPDWSTVPPEKWNHWQRLAAATHGAVTPGNVISLLAAASVPAGLFLIVARHSYVLGVVTLLAGRLCDMLDGYVAERTDTKSPLGEKLDAGTDKIVTITAVVVLGAFGIMPWWILALLLLPQVCIGALAVWALQSGRPLHPLMSGKLSMAASWLALLLFVLQHAAIGTLHMAIMALAYGLLALSAVLSGVAVTSYWRNYQQF